MGAPLTLYDKKLGERIENICERERFTQEQMASLMGVSVGRYKRFIYGEAKVPAECLAIIIDQLPVDPDYLLFGREGGVMRLVEYLLGCSDRERAEFHMELARQYRKKENLEKVDFMVDDLLIETNGKKSRINK